MSAAQNAIAPARVRQVAAPPDGWLDIKAVAAEMDGRSQSAREKKAVRLAGRLAQSNNPQEYIRVVKVGRCYYIDPRVEYKGLSLAERIRKRNERPVEIVFPVPDGIDDELRCWTQKDWRRFKIGWKVIYAWERISNALKHESAKLRLSVLHDVCAGDFEKLGMRPPSLRTIRIWKNESLNPDSPRWTGLRERRGQARTAGDYREFYAIFDRRRCGDSRRSTKQIWRDSVKIAKAESQSISIPSYSTACRRLQMIPPAHEDTSAGIGNGVPQ